MTRLQAPVVFVCEHGVAKSLLAKLLFERHARAAGLSVHVEARATHPEAALPSWMLEHLGSVGLDAGDFVPQPLAASDMAVASRVVSFDLDEVAGMATACEVASEPWDAIPLASVDFASTYAAIDARVRVLVEALRPAP